MCFVALGALHRVIYMPGPIFKILFNIMMHEIDVDIAMKPHKKDVAIEIITMKMH